MQKNQENFHFDLRIYDLYVILSIVSGKRRILNLHYLDNLHIRKIFGS